MRLVSSVLPKNAKEKYARIALRGVERLKKARYFLQSTRGRLVDRRDVVNASEVGAKAVSERRCLGWVLQGKTHLCGESELRIQRKKQH